MFVKLLSSRFILGLKQTMKSVKRPDWNEDRIGLRAPCWRVPSSLSAPKWLAYHGPQLLPYPLRKRPSQYSCGFLGRHFLSPYGLRTTSGQSTSASVLIASTAQSTMVRPYCSQTWPRQPPGGVVQRNNLELLFCEQAEKQEGREPGGDG